MGDNVSKSQTSESLRYSSTHLQDVLHIPPHVTVHLTPEDWLPKKSNRQQNISWQAGRWTFASHQHTHFTGMTAYGTDWWHLFPDVHVQLGLSILVEVLEGTDLWPLSWNNTFSLVMPMESLITQVMGLVFVLVRVLRLWRDAMSTTSPIKENISLGWAYKSEVESTVIVEGWSRNFWFSGRISCDLFLGTALWDDDVLLRADKRCFPGSCLVRGHVMFCWSGHLRGHVLFGKGVRITQQTVDKALTLVCLATLCWLSVVTP